MKGIKVAIKSIKGFIILFGIRLLGNYLSLKFIDTIAYVFTLEK